MCGIAGVWCTEYAQGKSAIQAMNRTQSHRGPNDEGIEVLRVPVGSLLFGHRRLSILDLSPAGHQPMVNAVTGDWIVFNGEIYNYLDLRKELQNRGVAFAGTSDTEVLLHALAAWGTDALSRIHGMFAFGFFRSSTNSLLLARDALGIKPLYFAKTDNCFLFASEVQAIEASGLVPRSIDRRALAGLLAYGAVQSPLCLSKDIKSLDPGTWMEVKMDRDPASHGGPAVRPFWRFPEPRETLEAGEVPEDEVHRLLKQVTKQHLISDVPVGIFLSSGLDSSAVAAISAELGANLETFTVSIADSEQFDENPVAEHTAASLGFRHHKIAIPQDRANKYVMEWLAAIDQPSFDGLNTFIVSNAVRQQGIIVALSGLGGDELFGGYASFWQVPKAVRWLRNLAALPVGVRKALASLVFGLGSDTRRRKAIDLASTPADLTSVYFRRRRLLSNLELEMAGLSMTEVGLGDTFQPAGADPASLLAGPNDFSSISRLESRYYMGNMLLRDTDVCGMANGLEIRVPFLDRRLVEYVLSLPERCKTGKWPKPLLRRALQNTLPKKVLDLPKSGFSLPHANWMLGPLRSFFQGGFEVLRSSGLVHPRCIDSLWQAFLRNPSGPEWSRAWMLGVLGHWYDRWRKNVPVAITVDAPPRLHS